MTLPWPTSAFTLERCDMNPLMLRPPIFVIETDVNPVAAGGLNPGWISGTPANLADGASADVLFDLGPLWLQYTLLQIVVLSVTATSLSAIQASSSDNTTRVAGRRVRTTSDTTPFATTFFTVTTSGGAQACFIRPMGRYLFLQVTNTAAGGAQGALAKVTVSGYPGA
jgi:hypothetical protein